MKPTPDLLNRPKIIFTPGAQGLVLEALGWEVNSEGLIAEVHTGLPVLTKSGNTVTSKEFAGAKDGYILTKKSESY